MAVGPTLTYWPTPTKSKAKRSSCRSGLLCYFVSWRKGGSFRREGGSFRREGGSLRREGGSLRREGFGCIGLLTLEAGDHAFKPHEGLSFALALAPALAFAVMLILILILGCSEVAVNFWRRQ